MKQQTRQRQLGIMLFVLILTVGIGFAHAGIIGTEQVAAKAQSSENIQKIHAALLRDDVKHILLAHGVKPEDVHQRINHLTDLELKELATKFDQLPAGSGPGLLLFVSGPIIFMLELMGVTDLTTTF